MLKTTREGFHQAGDHVPDPNLDLSFGESDPSHRVLEEYTPPFPRAVPPPIQGRLPGQERGSPTGPLQFLFGDTTIADFARYLGAPIGPSLSRITAFVDDRRRHALSLHRFLPYIGKRARVTSYSGS